MTGAHGLSGGIASLNRNILLAVADLAVAEGLQLNVVSLHESAADRPPTLPPEASYSAHQGDKKRFSLELVRRSLGSTLVLVDHVRVALPLLPLAWLGLVNTAIYAHGPEAWRNVTPTSIRMYQNADLCLANSAFTLRKMQSRFSNFPGVACPLGLAPEHHLHEIIPDALNEPLVLENLDGEQRELGEKVLLLVGRMHAGQEGKGHREIIRALPLLIEEHPEVQVVFAGTGDDQPALTRLAHREKVGERVFMPGFVSSELLERLYRKCYAFTMPSRQDGFGLVYLEAMNYGKPCVGCFDDGGECVIEHEETGLLVQNPQDVPNLVAVLGQLLDDPARAVTMGRHGFKRLHREFTSRAFQTRLQTHLRDLLS
jgi:glycosyltransferase involved in cell wall biosynthesis